MEVIQNEVNENPIGQTQENTDSNASADNIELDNIQSVIKQFKSTEELAKSKINSDKEYSKLKTEKKDLESRISETEFKYSKRLVQTDNNYLIELAGDNPELADRIAKEVYNRDLTDILNEIETSLTSGDSDDEIDDIVNSILGKDTDKKQRVDKDYIEKLAELKASQKMAAKIEEETKQKQKQVIKSTLNSFIESKSIPDDLKDKFIETYKDLSEGKEISEKNINKFLKASFSVFSEEYDEQFKKISSAKNNLNDTAPSKNKGGSSSGGISYSEEDVRIANLVGLSVEKYIASKSALRIK